VTDRHQFRNPSFGLAEQQRDRIARPQWSEVRMGLERSIGTCCLPKCHSLLGAQTVAAGVAIRDGHDLAFDRRPPGCRWHDAPFHAVTHQII